MFRFPWVDMHSLNLGWFLQKFNELRTDWATAEENITGALDAEIQRAEDALSDVFDARDAAAASATAAAGSASAAGTSATAAQNSATGAASSATLANQKATAAGLSEAAAAQSATQAGNSATAAAGSATQAGQSATNAAGSATAAGQSASAASGSATAAAGSASAAAGSASAAAGSASAAAQAASLIDMDATPSDVGKAIIVKTVADGKVSEYEFGEAGGGGESWYQADLTEADYDSTLKMILFDAGANKKIKEVFIAGQIVNDGTQSADEVINFGFGNTVGRLIYSCPISTNSIAPSARRFTFNGHFFTFICPSPSASKAFTALCDSFNYGVLPTGAHTISADAPLQLRAIERGTNFYTNFNDSRYFKIELPTWVPEWASIKIYYTLMEV